MRVADRQELVQRWDAFLLKIEKRFYESLGYAEEACKAQLVETDYDYETTFRAWQGMKAQIHDLITKIDETWQYKVQPQMWSMGDFYLEEGKKSSALNEKLIASLERFQRKLEGELSQAFYDYAIQIANKKASCSQCNANLELRKDIFRAQYITCGYCHAINTIKPETKFVKIGWGIVNNIADLKVQEHYDRMQEALEAVQKERKPVGVQFWHAYEKAYFRYWEAYFKERIKLSSDLAERYGADMERKRKEFDTYKQIQTR